MGIKLQYGIIAWRASETNVNANRSIFASEFWPPANVNIVFTARGYRIPSIFRSPLYHS
jgi:hypothetical protein